MATEDIVAFGAVILCVGAVFVAMIIALGLVFGKVQGGDGTKIILGCVGGAAIAAVLAAARSRTKPQRRKSHV